MTDQTAVATVKKTDAPAEWGTRGEIAALADRFRTMLPNAKDLNNNQILAAAQYSRLMDLNPFRGEVYFFPGKGGNLAVVDGYKALVRWADDKAPYDEWYEPLPLNDGEIYKLRCWILREDRKDAISGYIELGATFAEAREMVATFSDGVVTKGDMTQRNGKPKDPPTGWTWEQVARKRALKNALNLSHGAPSPREMAELSWKVNGAQTIPQDWDGAEDLSQHEAEKLAELRARDRDRQETWESLKPEEKQARFEANVSLLRGPENDAAFGDNGPQTATQGPTWDQPTFEAGEEEAAPAPIEKKKPKGAIIRTKNWAPACVDLAEQVPYYRDKNGGPNGWHLAGAALKCGHKEITDSNLADVLADLAEYAQAQQALAEEAQSQNATGSGESVDESAPVAEQEAMPF